MRLNRTYWGILFVGTAVALLNGCATTNWELVTLPPMPCHWANDQLRGETTAHVTDWLVVGPFPSPEAEPAAGGIKRTGFHQDFLETVGGETGSLKEGAIVPYTDAEGQPAEAIVELVHAGEDGAVDLQEQYDAEKCAAYAYALILVKRDAELGCLFGSDDWAKVWVNGELVHEVWEGDGRGLAPRSDQFMISLKRGINRVLVKVDQNTGPWGFSFELASPSVMERMRAEAEHRERITAVLDTAVEPVLRGHYTFNPGELPEVIWERLNLLEEAYGETEVTYRWFDGELNEVTHAEAPGRYAVYAEARTASGRVLRRATTFYCAPEDFFPWWPPYEIEAPYLPNPMVEEAVWKEQERAVRAYAGSAVVSGFYLSEQGAAFLAGMEEAKLLGRPATQLDEPSMRDQDYHLALKRKLLGMEDRYPPLAMPTKRADAVTVLRPGSPDAADVDPASRDAVRKVCRDWWEASKLPFTVLLARHGVVYFHEAFGELDGKPIGVEAKLPLASLTKGHCGLMLTQFLDQGLIDLDDPVGKYLPDFAMEGEKAITLRQCVTHTTGFEGHGNWGGMDNPWLDNLLATQLETLDPGKRYLYNGMGFDLAGKVMEAVSGKSIFRLMHENFFIPLGQDNPTIVDLGYGIDCTVEDLARVGQLVLNKGSYGDTRFFPEETWDRVVDPKPLKTHFPAIENSGDFRYNLGWHYVEERRNDVEGADGEEAPLIFSENTVMHGAASGAVLRIDFGNDLIVAMGRPDPGPEYGEYLTPFLMAVVDGLR